MQRWRKSSYSADTANCVEVAGDGGQVLVRDSKDPGPELAFDRSTFAAFVRAVRAGELGPTD